MLKRRLGVYLITLLVITGLAGTINDDSITKPQRKYAIGLMKESYRDIIESVNKLSGQQLNFQTSTNSSSIKEFIFQFAATEKYLWQKFENAMKNQANPEKRSNIKISDDQIANLEEDVLLKALSTGDGFAKKTSPASLVKTAETIKNQRQDYIKYMRTTTEDLRNHVVQLPSGWVDCYQLYLLITRYSFYISQKITALKSDPAFPK